MPTLKVRHSSPRSGTGPVALCHDQKIVARDTLGWVFMTSAASRALPRKVYDQRLDLSGTSEGNRGWSAGPVTH